MKSKQTLGKKKKLHEFSSEIARIPGTVFQRIYYYFFFLIERYIITLYEFFSLPFRRELWTQQGRKDICRPSFFPTAFYFYSLAIGRRYPRVSARSCLVLSERCRHAIIGNGHEGTVYCTVRARTKDVSSRKTANFHFLARCCFFFFSKTEF